MSSGSIELVAVQPFMQVDDYLEAAAFHAKIADLVARITAARERDAHGRFLHPALVVFPEHIGTFLSLASHRRFVRPGDGSDAVLRRLVMRRPLRLVASMLRHRTASPSAAVLLGESGKMYAIYRAAFRDAARRLAATVVAGSIMLPENAAGVDADAWQPRGNRLFNLSHTFTPDGHCVNVTKKVNLVPTLEDTLPLTRGEARELTPIDSPCGRVGVMICYDGFAEAHTDREPGFEPLGARLAAAGATLIAQPSANPWPWNERWVFCDAGENQLRREQWLREGLFSQLPRMPGVRYVVNPQLIGDILGTRFDGRSYIFARGADGAPTIVASAAADALDPASEEIVVARVPAVARAETSARSA